MSRQRMTEQNNPVGYTSFMAFFSIDIDNTNHISGV